MGLREDHQDAFLGEPCSGEALEALFQRFVERGRAGNVEAQLGGGLHLIDVLSAGGAARAKENASSRSSMAMSGVTVILGMASSRHRVVSRSLTAML